MKMKFTVQKIIATLVVAAITIGLFPKILGNDKVNAAGKHSITVTNGKAYTSDTYTTESTEAEAGADVYVKATAQSGKYVTGWNSSQVTVGEASRFTMPDEDVSVEPIYAAQTEYTIDLSGAVQVTNEDVLWSFLWSQGKASLGSLPGSYDLDKDLNDDIDVTYTGGVAEFTLASTCNFSGVIVASTHAIYGDNLPYKIIFNVPTTYTEYPLWVAGVQVTSANKDDILGDGGKAKFDPDTGILTLNNPVITAGSGYKKGVVYSEGIDLIVKGSASLTGSHTYAGISVNEKDGNGGKVTLNGDFTLNGYCGVHADDTVTISGGLIYISAGFDSSPVGISAEHVVITGGTVDIDEASYGIFADADFIVSGGTVNTYGGSCGIQTEKLTVSGGTVNVSGDSNGIRAPGDTIVITVNDGVLDATANYNNAIDEAITNITINYGSGIIVADGATDGKYFRISLPGSSAKYPVWIGSVQVTGDNKDDILGGGKAKFDPSTNTLTLNDPTIVGSHEDALIYSEGIDLTLEGSATFSSSSLGAIKVVKSGTNGGVLTLNGDFKIEEVHSTASAVLADNGINVTGGKITNTSGKYGLKTDGDISISGGEVNAFGTEWAIYAKNDISISGGKIWAAGYGNDASGILGNDVTITSGEITIGAGDNGLICDGHLEISGGSLNATITGQTEASAAICADSISISGGEITVSLSKGDAVVSCDGDMSICNATVSVMSYNGAGILVFWGDLNINSGTVSATSKCPSNPAKSYGVYVFDGDITIGNDITSVSFSGDAMGLFTPFNLRLGHKLIIKSPENGKLNTAGNCIIGSDGKAAKTVTLVPQTESTAYPVWVGNTQVTSANKDDILGDGGKAKYDPDSKTLVFDDPAISSYGLYGSNVYFEQDINIEGTLTITGGQFGIIDNGYKHSVTVKGDISIDVSNSALAAKNIEIKDGKLNLSTTSSNTIICKDITISGGYVNIDCSSSSAYAIAALGGGDIVISGGTVIATCSAAYCIESFEGKVIISNGVTKVDAKGASDSIKADAGIEIGEVLNITTPSDGVISSDGKFIAESDGTTPASHAVIERDPAKFPVTVVITTWDKDNNCISEVGGTVTGAPTVTKKGDTIEVTVTPKDGYEIVEISFGDGLIGIQTGMSTKFTVPADYTPLSDGVQIDVLFRAKAATPSTYTVTFNTDGGSAVASQTVTSGAKATKPADPAKEGFTFDGWYKDAAFTTAFDFNTVINSDVTVYAKWNATPAVYYTVVSGANGTCTQGTDFVMQIKRSENDEKTYSDYFTGVKIDDKLLVNGTDYTAAPGSVIVTIKGSTLSDLAVGGHIVTIEFKDGTAVTSLNVKAAANVVKTGEDMSPALWTGVACVGSAVMLFAAVVTQKKRPAVRKSVRKSVIKF